MAVRPNPAVALPTTIALSLLRGHIPGVLIRAGVQYTTLRNIDIGACDKVKAMMAIIIIVYLLPISW